jgi:hypothetical protein
MWGLVLRDLIFLALAVEGWVLWGAGRSNGQNQER